MTDEQAVLIASATLLQMDVTKDCPTEREMRSAVRLAFDLRYIVMDEAFERGIKAAEAKAKFDAALKGHIPDGSNDPKKA